MCHSALTSSVLFDWFIPSSIAMMFEMVFVLLIPKKKKKKKVVERQADKLKKLSNQMFNWKQKMKEKQTIN